jgi:hypothetical protein
MRKVFLVYSSHAGHRGVLHQLFFSSLNPAYSPAFYFFLPPSISNGLFLNIPGILAEFVESYANKPGYLTYVFGMYPRILFFNRYPTLKRTKGDVKEKDEPGSPELELELRQ